MLASGLLAAQCEVRSRVSRDLLIFGRAASAADVSGQCPNAGQLPFPRMRSHGGCGWCGRRWRRRVED